MSNIIMGRMSSLIVVLRVLNLAVQRKFLQLLGEEAQSLSYLVHALRNFGYLSVQLFQVLSVGGRGHYGGSCRIIPRRSSQYKESLGLGGK
jgi:hypothetical protein